jgi:HEAT repeat protein
LRYMIWRDPCRNALKQHCHSLGPDGTRRSGEDVKPAAAPVLIVLLNDDDERVQNEAAFAIGIIGDRVDTSAAIPGLIAMLKGSRANRLNAAFALGELGHRAEVAIPALIQARESDDPKTRQIAAEALQSIAPDSFPAD